ncbi:RND superfamily drug exporter [Pandoraea communis]|uniref:RND superfamily drug exporter n=1 Tax=Pandoraea communis TaxID=2508297 RepID=A0A5E4VTJ4_9BURK|nr:MMPL family transporter [Pandoraea communis]VVE15541.1 RND superfamily drug exporter [Pandoraea communis]
MTPRTRAIRRALTLALAAGLVLLGIWLLAVRHLPLQTNVLALLPATERNPVAEQAVDHLAGSVSDRVVVLIGAEDASAARAAAARFDALARANDAFSSVQGKIPPFDPAFLSNFYLPHRFQLLSQEDRAVLEAQLRRNPSEPPALPPLPLANSPFGLTDAADDPFGWLDRWLTRLPFGQLRMLPENGWLSARHEGKTWVLVLLQTRGPAFDSDVQQRVIRFFDTAQAQIVDGSPGLEVLRSGAVFHAAGARAQAERELHRIGVVATLGIALLTLWAFRSGRLLAMGLATVAFGTLCAAVATLVIFGELHLLTLVFGAALIGETVDYAIQYFVGVGGLTRDAAQRTLPVIRPALRIALATSVLGYAILGAVPFPALRQIAVFALAGLLSSYVFVVWALPAFLPREVPPLRAPVIRLAQRWLRLWGVALAGRQGTIIGCLILLACLPGWWRLGVDDDIRRLISRDPAWVAQEQAISRITGIDGATQFWLVQADSEEALLRREEQLGARLDQAVAGKDAPFSGWTGISQFVPSVQRQLDNRALLGAARFDAPDMLATAMTRAGFRAQFAHQYANAYAAEHETPPLRIGDWLAWPGSTPYRMLWIGPVGSSSTPQADSVKSGGFASLVRPQGLRDSDAAARVAADLPGVTYVDKAASISSLFARYRHASGLWFAAALVVVAGLLARRYGWRGALATIMPTLLATAAVFATFGYLGLPLTLFAQMGLMLVLGVGVNYAIFLREGELRAGEDERMAAIAVAGTLMSAATTLLSFGLLAFSGMPSLQAFGLTLTIGIALALLLAPYSLRFPELRS